MDKIVNNSVLEVKNLTKTFDSFTAVNNISFTLKEGEILGFLGINGAGKTTTIQMLLGVLQPTSGSVNYFGSNLFKHRSKIMEQVNFSSTYTQLPWTLSVYENLTFISYLYDIKNRKERVNKIIEIFDLQPLINKLMYQLSAGQITKINLAKSFINFPKILLLGEPTASLDVEIADTVRKLLIKQREKFNVSIVLTSHNMAEVEEVCDRVIFINDGKIIANDTPENLANSIQISHVSLSIINVPKKLISFLQTKQISYIEKGKSIIIDIEENEIANILQEIPKHGITYKEISIEKPTLEDYFLQVVNK